MLWSVGIHCEKIQQNPCKIPLKSWKHPVKMHLSPNRNFHMLPKSCPQILGDRRNTAAFHKAQSVRQLNLLRLRSQTYFAGGFLVFWCVLGGMESSTILEKNPTGCVSADVWRFHVDLDLLASGRRSQASGDRGQSPWPMVCCDLWGPCFVGFSIVFSVSHGSFNSLI